MTTHTNSPRVNLPRSAVRLVNDDKRTQFEPRSLFGLTCQQLLQYDNLNAGPREVILLSTRFLI
jgi:hypothetical protein